jgi:hypothetical protein
MRRLMLGFWMVLGVAGLIRAQSSIPAPSLASPQPVPILVSPIGAPNPPPSSAAPARAHEELVHFDYQSAELRWQDGHWLLMGGNVILKDFGSNQVNGREALRIVQELRLTERGVIGKPVPSMEYWLSRGEAPAGILHAAQLSSFDPAELKVESFQGQWFIRHGQELLLTFGPHPEEARRALEIIQHHGFNQIGFVGQPTPVMTYFVINDKTGPRKTSSGPNSPLLPAIMGPNVDKATLQRMNPRQLHLLESLVAGANVIGERVPIDAHEVRLRQDHQQWKLCQGDYCLANFGMRENDAREALRVVQHYHFTEKCWVGEPTPASTYYLVGGQPPRGVLLGLRSAAFRPEELSLKQVSGIWYIYFAGRPLLRFGGRVEEARQMLQVIQHYQFDHICRVGDADPAALTFLVRDR